MRTQKLTCLSSQSQYRERGPQVENEDKRLRGMVMSKACMLCPLWLALPQEQLGKPGALQWPAQYAQQNAQKIILMRYSRRCLPSTDLCPCKLLPSKLRRVLSSQKQLFVRSEHDVGPQRPSINPGSQMRKSCVMLLCTDCRRSSRKKNHYNSSSQLRADQMPGPPRDGQLRCTLFQSMRRYTEQHQ